MKLEDTFKGELELTASERAYLEHALTDSYMRGGWCPPGHNKRDFMKGVMAKVYSLKLHRMVTPDGTKLVSVEEHDKIVAELYPGTPQPFSNDYPGTE